jgi:hypothetical protein
LSVLRPLVEEWIARHETPQQAFLELEASSPYKADTWRKRLSDTVHLGRNGDSWCGWWANTEIDFADVDELLTAADLSHLWQTDLADLLPGPSRSIDGTHGSCQHTRPLKLTRHYRRRARIPEADLRKMYLLHRRRKLSVQVMSRQLYRQYGYASEKEMSSAISAGWRLLILRTSHRGRGSHKATVTSPPTFRRACPPRARLRRKQVIL